MKANFFPSILIFFAGVMIPLAVAFNGRIGQGLKSPLLGAAAIPVVGTIFITLVILLFRSDLPSSENFRDVPWFAWLGGAMVTLYLNFSNAMLGKNFDIARSGMRHDNAINFFIDLSNMNNLSIC